MIIPSFIRDSFDFLQKLPKSCKQSDTLCTLDVKNLYTKIPHKLGLEAIEYFIDNNSNILNPRFSKQFILESVECILNNAYFSYNKEFYLQVNGTTMGTIMAPVYANLTMAFLEKNLYFICKQIDINIYNYIILNFKRYLDDCFIILDNTLINESFILNTLNHLHPDIQFTVNTSGKQINFLDILVIKDLSNYNTTDNNTCLIETDIYYKETNNFNYLPFDSNHPRHIKRNIPYNLMNRLNTIVFKSLTKSYRMQEIKYQLLKLKYPKNLIDDAINKTTSIKINKKMENINNETINFITFYSPISNNIFQEIIKPNFQMLQLQKESFINLNIRNTFMQPLNILNYFQTNTNFKIKKCNEYQDFKALNED